MSKEANIATQQKMGEIINSYHFEKLHEVSAVGVKDHDPADDQDRGPEGFVHWFTQFHSAFPDFKIAVEHLVADEDNVAFAYTITGTQDGPFNGIPATEKDQGSRHANLQVRLRLENRGTLGSLSRGGHPPADRCHGQDSTRRPASPVRAGFSRKDLAEFGSSSRLHRAKMVQLFQRPVTPRQSGYGK